jgi:predicted  nucleic acid-binding Zn-ribbon protein
MTDITAAEREAKVIAKAEKRAVEHAVLGSRLDGHEIRLNAINGSINRTAHAIEGLTSSFNEDRTATATMVKALQKIEEEHTERTREAREDRRSVKIALYAFATAISASGVGALLVTQLK